MRLHEDGILDPPRINPSANLQEAVEHVKKTNQNGFLKALDWLGEAFVGNLVEAWCF